MGSGSFGDVYKAKVEMFSEYVAIKFPKQYVEAETLSLLQEAHIMNQLQHENVVKFHGIIVNGLRVSDLSSIAITSILMFSIHCLHGIYTWYDNLKEFCGIDSC